MKYEITKIKNKIISRNCCKERLKITLMGLETELPRKGFANCWHWCWNWIAGKS